jgi:hypothetical protein
MEKIVLNNKHLTAIAKGLAEDFNKIEFLAWYHGINPAFNYDVHPMAGAVSKHFSNDKKYLKLFEFPELEINDRESLKKLLCYSHGSYRVPLIQVLKNDFKIDYWNEVLNFACENKDLGYSTYYSLLSHSMNDGDFTETNIDKIKDFLDKFISSINQSKNKRFSEILQYISFAIGNKDLFGNDWLVDSLNRIFKNPDDGSSKNFNFQVDKISQHFMNLDFSKTILNPELKRVLKGKLPLTTSNESTKPFFWSIDIPRYCMTHKLVQQLLLSNCITGMDIIEKYLKDDAEVLSHFVKREKNKISLSVIYENPKLEKTLNVLLDMILKKTEMNTVINSDDFEKSFVFIDLNDSMTIHDKKTKVNKV